MPSGRRGPWGRRSASGRSRPPGRRSACSRHSAWGRWHRRMPQAMGPPGPSHRRSPSRRVGSTAPRGLSCRRSASIRCDAWGRRSARGRLNPWGRLGPCGPWCRRSAGADGAVAGHGANPRSQQAIGSPQAIADGAAAGYGVAPAHGVACRRRNRPWYQFMVLGGMSPLRMPAGLRVACVIPGGRAGGEVAGAPPAVRGPHPPRRARLLRLPEPAAYLQIELWEERPPLLAGLGRAAERRLVGQSYVPLEAQFNRRPCTWPLTAKDPDAGRLGGGGSGPTEAAVVAAAPKCTTQPIGSALPVGLPEAMSW